MRLINEECAVVIENKIDLFYLINLFLDERFKFLGDSKIHDRLTECIDTLYYYKHRDFNTITIIYDRAFLFVYDIIRDNFLTSITVNL